MISLFAIGSHLLETEKARQGVCRQRSPVTGWQPARQPEPSFPLSDNGQNKSDQLFTVDRLWLGYLEMYSTTADAIDFAISQGTAFPICL